MMVVSFTAIALLRDAITENTEELPNRIDKTL